MYKLLIADDEPLVCVGVQSMLEWEKLGIEVIGSARNGQQAAEMIEDHLPDIVITDIRMPLKDGLCLARESLEKHGNLPVFIILTSYEDFEYARQALKAQAVDYLIKLELDEEKLENAINKAIGIVRKYKAEQPGRQALARGSMQAFREKFFIRLFNNLFDSEEMYLAQKEDLGIDLAYQGFVVANCEIVVPAGAPNAVGDQLAIYSSAMQLVRETLAKYFTCYVVPLDMWHFTVVFCLNENEAANYRTLVQAALVQTADLLRDYLNLTLHSALGNVVKTPRELSTSYRQSQRCVHGMTDADPVVFCEKLAEGQDGEYIVEVQEIRQGIRRAFEELDTAALDEALTAVADAFINHPDDLLQAMDTTCNILYMAISLLPEGEQLLEQIFEDEPEGYRVLYRLRDTASIAGWVHRLRDGCNELLQTRRQSYKEHLVANVKTYIDENLDKRLSLQEVAAVFNFNPNYLSQLFSKYSGEGFVEYITSARVNAAREMLLQGELRIYEIAEKLGFESSFYFSKVFKKVEGMSPRDYVQKHTGNLPEADAGGE